MSYPFTDLSTREEIIAKAAESGITLTPEDFRESAEYGLTLDGMPAAEWLDAMTMR